MFGRKRLLRDDQADLIREFRGLNSRLSTALARNSVMLDSIKILTVKVQQLQALVVPAKPHYNQRRAEERIEELSAANSMLRLKLSRIHSLMTSGEADKAGQKPKPGFNW